MTNNSFLELASKIGFSISLDPKETFPIVPTQRNAPSIDSRVTSIDSRVTSLETTSNLGKGILGTLVALVLALFGFFYLNIIPDKVEQGIANSKTLETQFDGIRNNVQKLDGRIEQLISTIRPLVSPRIVSAALLDLASADERALPAALPEIRNLLAAARDMNVAIRGEYYNKAAKPLFQHYLVAKGSLKGEIWKTLVDLANTRTVTDALLQPLSENPKSYREGDVDLSEQTVWENTIFKKGKVKISKPDQDLELKQVRFVEKTFEAEENQTTQKLLESVLQSETPEVTATVARFKVLEPKGKVKEVAVLKRTAPRATLARFR